MLTLHRPTECPRKDAGAWHSPSLRHTSCDWMRLTCCVRTQSKHKYQTGMWGGASRNDWELPFSSWEHKSHQDVPLDKQGATTFCPLQQRGGCCSTEEQECGAGGGGALPWGSGALGVVQKAPPAVTPTAIQGSKARGSLPCTGDPTQAGGLCFHPRSKWSIRGPLAEREAGQTRCVVPPDTPIPSWLLPLCLPFLLQPPTGSAPNACLVEPRQLRLSCFFCRTFHGRGLHSHYT